MCVILIVEDNKNLLDVIKYRVEKEGFTVITAMDGEEGLDKSYVADLILLDLSLPKMNGDVVLETLRQSGILTPVIIVSGDKSVEMRERVSKLGISDFLTKPFTMNHLMSRIRANVRIGKNISKLQTMAQESIQQIDSLMLSLTNSGILQQNYD